jgi:hypothetical protein
VATLFIASVTTGVVAGFLFGSHAKKNVGRDRDIKDVPLLVPGAVPTRAGPLVRIHGIRV